MQEWTAQISALQGDCSYTEGRRKRSKRSTGVRAKCWERGPSRECSENAKMGDSRRSLGLGQERQKIKKTDLGPSLFLSETPQGFLKASSHSPTDVTEITHFYLLSPSNIMKFNIYLCTDQDNNMFLICIHLILTTRSIFFKILVTKEYKASIG